MDRNKNGYAGTHHIYAKPYPVQRLTIDLQSHGYLLEMRKDRRATKSIYKYMLCHYGRTYTLIGPHFLFIKSIRTEWLI